MKQRGLHEAAVGDRVGDSQRPSPSTPGLAPTLKLQPQQGVMGGVGCKILKCPGKHVSGEDLGKWAPVLHNLGRNPAYFSPASLPQKPPSYVKFPHSAQWGEKDI